MKEITFIDLFAGIGGMRKGFELACAEMRLTSRCVFTSEIKPHAVEILKQNHPEETVAGDITQVDASAIPHFDFLLGGFPCQAFSVAGQKRGFEDARGTLFLDVARIIKEKQPKGFLLENVEGLVKHDRANPKDKMGRTLSTILSILSQLGYKVSWKVLDAKHFGVPQERKRIYIVGTKAEVPSLDGFGEVTSKLADILQQGQPTAHTPFTRAVHAHCPLSYLPGKSFNDKRGGRNNIHSWEIELKGYVTYGQKQLLNRILTERRRKVYAEGYAIDRMDGMPLTLQQIKTFSDMPDLEETLEHLARLGYLKKEHPKKKVGNRRVQDETLPLGYNIVAGKMSFQINKVLHPCGLSPTLTAMDMAGLYVVDGKGLRQLTLREGLRLFGYPDDYKFSIEKRLGYDLLGNTVVVPVVKAVAKRVIESLHL